MRGKHTKSGPAQRASRRVAKAISARPKPRGGGLDGTAEGFVWSPEAGELDPVAKVNRVPLDLLRGIERQAEVLLANTRRHARGLPANNALLWGARGTGKSSLIKAVHANVNREVPNKRRLALVEIHREDAPTLPTLLKILRRTSRRFILFCDDLSFEGQDASYKALKSVLEGGIEGRPENVVFYATSNRRHLMAREMIENERAAAIHDTEAIEEKVSLSDRFGLWLGFHHLDQDTYLRIVDGYAAAFKLPIAKDALRARAMEWAVTRGARSGRVAWQFVQDLAGELGVRMTL
ncbi:MAG: ATP-binding protein [Rhodospirillaceae bacterium]|nr:ATP-binding protein [Rhodospirillaceae bacterium]